MKKLTLALLSLVALIGITACNGGGSSASKPEAAAPVVKPVEVKADPNIFPVWSDIYSGGADWSKDNIYIWNGLKLSTVTNANDAFAGNEFMRMKVNPGVDWFGFGLHCGPANPSVKNMVGYNYMTFACRAKPDAVDFKILIKHSYSQESWLDLKDGQFGFVKDGQWHQVKIPIETWIPKVNLKSVVIWFAIAQGNGVTPKASTIDFDEIYWTKE